MRRGRILVVRLSRKPSTREVVELTKKLVEKELPIDSVWVHNNEIYIVFSEEVEEARVKGIWIPIIIAVLAGLGLAITSWQIVDKLPQEFWKFLYEKTDIIVALMAILALTGLGIAIATSRG